QLMRYITSEIVALWKHSRMKHAQTDSTACLDPNLPFDGEYIYTWRPWEHIYAINKVTKGPTIPLYNPHGKYAIRLYWLGCWRKIIIDDTIPYNDSDQMLLPATTRPHELWPMLLTKALVKVASLDYNGGNNACEFGDFSVIQCLTGWLPEAIPLQMGHMEEIWELLRVSLPEFQLPELPS
ncbi:Androglobin, partial [Lamellibrachia satsuma]